MLNEKKTKNKTKTLLLNIQPELNILSKRKMVWCKGCEITVIRLY